MAIQKFYALIGLTFLLGFSQLKAAPLLNSHPTASATIYLDFDGHDVNSSMWNYGIPFSCVPAVMTDAQITEAFNRVAEDFRPFDVNVTTDSTKFLAAPLAQRVRIIITPTSAWYASVAGIAYITSFTWGDDTPAFVFSDRLLNDAKRVAEAISHETGHTLGLYHQASYDGNCTLTSSYSTGAGTGITSWGPIMGNVASKNVTQWNYGPTPNGCTFLQDNLSIITTTNGFGYRTDDVPNDYRNATDISVTTIPFSKEGIISNTSDVDFFKLSLGTTGRLTLNVTPYSVGPDFSGANLDVQITLHDARGNVMETYNDVNTLNIVIDTTLVAGNYYIQIDGAGSLNSINDYGSVGAYSIVGTLNTTIITDPIIDPSKDEKKPKKDDKNDEESDADAEDEDTPTDETSITIASSLNAASNLTPIETNKIFTVIKPLQQPVIIKATAEYAFLVIDNYGRAVVTGKAAAGTKTIDIRSMPTGIYTLRLINSKETRTDRFLNR